MKNRFFNLLAIVTLLLLVGGSSTFVSAQYNAAYRTFKASELTVVAPASQKPLGMNLQFQITNPTGLAVSGLTVEVNSRLVHITSFAPFTNVQIRATAAGLKFTLTGATVAAGDHVTLSFDNSQTAGTTLNAQWTNAYGRNIGALEAMISPSLQQPVIPMPNTANVREIFFAQTGNANPLVIGVRQPVGYPGAWVELRNSRNFRRSLLDHQVTHAGVPHGLDYNNRGFALRGMQQFLSPAIANNELFAQLVALKLNLRLSEAGISPNGLDNLAYYDNGHSLSGMPLNKIAARADSMMTFYQNYSRADFNELDYVVHQINVAFDAPIDTVAYLSGLQLTGVTSNAVGLYLFTPQMAFPKTTHTAVTAMNQPVEFRLNQNYPNPFNPTTNISFTVNAPAIVTLKVYNTLGQEVASLMDRQNVSAGETSVKFDGNNLASGTYFYRVTTQYTEGNSAPVSDVKKMMLVK